MLEPPSPDLVRRLTDWQLCSPRDLRRARSIVRRLAEDLPAFDSVWIDALVQLGRLTPYQARVLESERPEALAAGEYILLDELGRGATSRTWLARSTSGTELWVLKRTTAGRERQAAVVEHGRQVIDAASRCRHPQLVAPQRCWEDAAGFWTVSRQIRGIPLSELLVRRGRFPSHVVWEIGKQVLEALSAWHATGQVHGDVRLTHVRITDRGTAVVVEAGHRAAVELDVAAGTSLSSDCYDGIAPELIGVGANPSAASDLYALGCVLWQLLAGRPPYPVADPLAKLAAHQTRDMEDVREWAPDVPPALAEGIHWLTRRNRSQRPSAADELLMRWGRSTVNGRRRLRAFRREFDVAVPHMRSLPASSVPWGAALATAATLAIATWVLADRGLRADLLSLAARWQSSAPTEPVAPAPLEDRLPLPAPSSDGTIWLTEAGPYGVESLRAVGNLTIRAARDVCPEIVVRDQPLKLAAQSVTLDGIRVRMDRLFKGEPSKALILVRSQSLTARRCWFDGGDLPRKSAALADVVGIGWQLVDPLDPASGVGEIRDCVVRGAAIGLFAKHAARRMLVQNVLGVQRGPLLVLAHDVERPVPLVDCRRVTLRGSGSLLRFDGGINAQAESLRLQVTNCVLNPRATQTLLEVEAALAPGLTPASIHWTGEGTVIPPGVELLGAFDAEASSAAPLSTDEMVIEGLSVSEFTFAGLRDDHPADSMLSGLEGPRRSTEFPGIDAEPLLRCTTSAAAADDAENR